MFRSLERGKCSLKLLRIGEQLVPNLQAKFPQPLVGQTAVNVSQQGDVSTLQGAVLVTVGNFVEPAVCIQSRFNSLRDLRGRSLVATKKCVCVGLGLARFA